jgi:hypothetical protein
VGAEAEPPPAAKLVREGEPERVGELELRRYRRPDGRALLLFRAVPEEAR